MQPRYPRPTGHNRFKHVALKTTPSALSSQKTRTRLVWLYKMIRALGWPRLLFLERFPHFWNKHRPSHLSVNAPASKIWARDWNSQFAWAWRECQWGESAEVEKEAWLFAFRPISCRVCHAPTSSPFSRPLRHCFFVELFLSKRFR